MEKFIIKKKYGQNFIKDKNLLVKIVSNIEITEKDLVVEIGPGQGDLTDAILINSPHYIGYEIDDSLNEYLSKFNNEKQKIIYGDFLKQNVIEEINKIKYKKLYIIANLPYYITTPIIKKIINDKLPVDEMLLMIQKEVADRLSSPPKHREYGSLTVFMNYYFDVKKLFDVKKENFIPRPNVDSTILKFSISKSNKKVNDESKFNKLLKDSFQFKRKTIKNNLKDYDLEKIEQILVKNNLTLQSRAEEIPLLVYIEIANSI